MKRYPIAAKIAGSIGILPCCALNDIFHIGLGVWMLAQFVRPLLATVPCVWEIWSGSNNRVYMYHAFHLAKKKEKKACHHTDFEADLWPETGGVWATNLSFATMKKMQGHGLDNNEGPHATMAPVCCWLHVVAGSLPHGGQTSLQYLSSTTRNKSLCGRMSTG